MITARFYQFNKKVNSTKRPTGNGTEIQISFKGNDSIVAPSILLDVSSIDYNYCYIPSLKRYYFVSNVILSTNKVKEYVLAIDVLATYKTEILASTKYVIRSAAYPNQYIADDTWVHNSNYTETNQTAALSGYDSSGCYLVSIINPVGAGSANPASTMYAMTESQLFMFMLHMFDMDSGSYSDITDMDLAATFFNPFQYVTSCRWYPFAQSSITSESNERIKYGWYEAPLTVNGKRVTSYGKRIDQSITIGSYSDWTDRDNNWTRYSLYIPSCGMIDIDAAFSGKTLTCHLDIDYNTGQTFATLVDSNDSQIVAQTAGKIGADVAISQVAGNLNIPGSLKDLLSTGANIAGGFLAGGGAHAVQDAVIGYQKMSYAGMTHDYAAMQSTSTQSVNAGKEAAGSIADAVKQTILNPTASKTGSDGCRYTIMQNHHFRLYKRKYNRYWDASAEIGGMCHSMRLLSTLSGYTKLANGVIECSGTVEEKNGITTFLENGFYIE